jgi:hypothetical protein
VKRFATYRSGFFLMAGLMATVLLTAGICDSGTTSAQQAAIDKAAKNQVYQPQNNVELNNYNARQKLADDPTTILWCTGAFPIPSSPLFTVPILGKLTSASKRPFSTSQVVIDSSNTTYSPELPGPDGMYGPSDSYRYGFTPGGVYVEFSGSMDTFCTTVPTVWQRQNTTIVVTTDNPLTQAAQACQAVLPKPPTVPTPAQLAQCQALLVAAVGK